MVAVSIQGRLSPGRQPLGHQPSIARLSNKRANILVAELLHPGFVRSVIVLSNFG